MIHSHKPRTLHCPVPTHCNQGGVYYYVIPLLPLALVRVMISVKYIAAGISQLEFSLASL